MQNPDTFFIFSAIHYYVAGRYSVLAGLNPTAGNQLHHAVEMCLKGGLAKNGKTLDELKKFCHRLPAIWDEFKTHFSGSSLDCFDSVIRELHRFEDVRYPDSIVTQGMSCVIDPGKRPFQPLSAPPIVPRYELYLAEIDELMVKLFAVASFNLPAFTGSLTPSAKEYLREWNEMSPYFSGSHVSAQ